MTKAKDIVDELYHFRDHYFEFHTLDKAKDKVNDVENKLKEVLSQLESVSLEAEDVKKDETEFLLQKGRAINIVPDHDQRAEDCLSKAVKRNPKSWQAWNELGISYWKKGEIATAKNCFEGALKQNRNKLSLQSMSMILRQLGKTPEEKLDFIYQSLEIAKEALQLDMSDGLSWYCLGNANLNLFFLANQNSKILKHSMHAYTKALEDKVARTHPDLHLNQATALRYEGSYQEALDAYKKATAYDPIWKEPEEKSKELLRYLELIGTMTKQKGCLKARQVRSLVKSIKPHHIGPYGPKPNSAKTEEVAKEKRMLSQLKEGANPGVVIVGKVVCHIPNPVPFTFCLIDEEETCVSVCVYNQAEGKGVVIGDSVAIPEPSVQYVKVSCDDTKSLEFVNIRVFSPIALAVNGRLMPSDLHAPAVVSVVCKSD